LPVPHTTVVPHRPLFVTTKRLYAFNRCSQAIAPSVPSRS
jgi:hypothetical protein